MTITLSLSDVEDLTLRALGACNTSDANARSVAASVVASEADGIHSHGLARLPTYCEHARCGKIDGQAVPEMEEVAAAGLKVDARDGFAHPAIDLGLPALTALAKAKGLAAMAVTNSYNCGVCGYHVERIAEAGLIALGYVNAPASIAPWGGKQAVFGTNPMSFAVPRPGAPPLVIDQSSSVIARSEVIIHADAGEAIPEGWALDKDGKPTTDPKAALAGGTMVPSGQYKGGKPRLDRRGHGSGAHRGQPFDPGIVLRRQRGRLAAHGPVLHRHRSLALCRRGICRRHRAAAFSDDRAGGCPPAGRPAARQPHKRRPGGDHHSRSPA